MKKIFGTFLVMILAISFVQAQTADEIAQKYVDAIGGTAKWQSLKSRKMEITMMTSGIELPGVVYGDAKGRQKMELTFQGMKIIQAYDGETAWAQSPPQGMPQPTKLTGAQADEVKDGEFLNEFVNYKARGMKLEMKGEEVLDGKSYFRIDLTTPKGKLTKYYFDKETYLVAASKENSVSVGQEVTSFVSNYKEFGGIKVPTQISVKVGGVEIQALKVNNVELNVELTDDIFAYPGN